MNREYKCDHCEYVSDRKNNLERHVDVKHPKKDDYSCIYCGMLFSNRQNKWRHEKYSCKSKPDNNNLIINLIQQLAEKDKKLEDKDKKIEELIEENRQDRSKMLNIIENNSHTTDKSVSTLAYVVKHYKKAPAIKKLTQKGAIKMLEYKGDNKYDTLTAEEKMVIAFRVKRLHEFLGDLIINTYKDSEDPTNQSVWASDTARLSFVIMKGIEKGKKEWIEDRSGKKILNLIIDPLVDKAKQFLATHSNNCNDLFKGEKLNSDYDSEDSEFSESDKYDRSRIGDYNLITDMETIVDINKVIGDRSLHDKILKYICPFFKLESYKKK